MKIISAGAGTSAANVNTSAQGYFIAPFGSIANSGPITVTGSANQVRAFQIVIPFAMTISKVSVNVTTADAVNTVMDVGIYDANKNRVAYTNGGISVATTGLKTVNLAAAVTLPAGVYYFAQTAVSTTAACTGTTGAATPGNALVTNAWGNAANAATSGVLPTTLGAISNVGAEVVYAKFEP